MITEAQVRMGISEGNRARTRWLGLHGVLKLQILSILSWEYDIVHTCHACSSCQNMVQLKRVCKLPHSKKACTLSKNDFAWQQVWKLYHMCTRLQQRRSYFWCNLSQCSTIKCPGGCTLSVLNQLYPKLWLTVYIQMWLHFTLNEMKWNFIYKASLTPKAFQGAIQQLKGSKPVIKSKQVSTIWRWESDNQSQASTILYFWWK